jgi:hypothetical protein|nr:MAG TPA: hypothetical protein [Bacteriophage sp.]
MSSLLDKIKMQTAAPTLKLNAKSSLKLNTKNPFVLDKTTLNLDEKNKTNSPLKLNSNTKEVLNKNKEDENNKQVYTNEKDLNKVEEVLDKDVTNTEDVTNKNEEVVTTEEETEVEEKPKKRRKRKSSTLSDQEPNSITKCKFEDVNIDVFDTKYSFEEAATIIQSKFVNDEWLDFRKEVLKDLEEIKIDSDLNPGAIKVVIEQLAILYDKIAIPLQEANDVITCISDKDVGIGTIYKAYAASSIEKSNADIRSAAGYKVLEKVNYNGNEVNLLVVLMAAKLRYNFLNSVKNIIDFKRNLLITISSSNKIEASLI